MVIKFRLPPSLPIYRKRDVGMKQDLRYQGTFHWLREVGLTQMQECGLYDSKGSFASVALHPTLKVAKGCGA